MRWQAVIVLIAVGLGTIAPPLPPPAGADCGQSMIGSLNICHSATSSLPSTGAKPCVTTDPCRHIPAPHVEFYKSTDPVFAQLFLPKQNEHSPRA